GRLPPMRLVGHFYYLEPHRMSAPECERRAVVEGKSFCRDPRIKTYPYLVNARQCELCVWRATPAPSLRDIPATLAQIPKPRRSIGLGDVVAGAIKLATFGLVKPCGGCGSRRTKLNRVRLPLP
ncbi:MAG TPA: hypothetical protein VG713_19215, partial [Pirellulales bacterium]|nr:hypothetical protein [Pirellulales bacterium]